MYSFARRPLWILSHVLVVVAILVMVRLGFWQHSRWQEESLEKDQIEAGMAAEPVPLDSLLPAGATDPGDVPESLRFRRVTVSGTWRPEDQVVIRSRSLGGSPGGWLLTPLVQPDGTAVQVVRGWLPLVEANGGPPYKGTDPPAGEVTVTGVVGLTQPQPSFGATDPPTGHLESLIHIDIERLARQSGVPLAPVWLMAEGAQPPTSPTLQAVTVDLPTPDQNMSYMVQWWIFATIAAVGYPLILRSVARHRAGLDRRNAPPEEDGEIYVPTAEAVSAGDGGDERG